MAILTVITKYIFLIMMHLLIHLLTIFWLYPMMYLHSAKKQVLTLDSDI